MTAKTSPAVLSPAKRILFSIILVAIPVIVLLLLEFFLRAIDYGPNLRLFTTRTIRGTDYYAMNPEVKGRYFGTIDFSATASPDLFLVSKPAGTFRVFFLGGSTTVGYPYWYNGSFSSFLRQRLRHVFPDRQIEVVNVGMTATNSFTALDMARDIVAYQPDLLIVYDGHNEFYGALGVSSVETLGGSRFISDLYLRLLRVKTFLLVRNAVSTVADWFRAEPVSASRATLMERLAKGKYVAYDSPVYRTAFHSLKVNLEELVELCRDHSIPLILSTQVSNLKDLPPFISGTTSEEPALRQRIEDLIRQAATALADQRLADADSLARSAYRMDTTFARSAFALGLVRKEQRRFHDAEQFFRLARDYDQLRFRMSSDFNELVKGFGSHPNVFVADIEAVFRSNSPDSLIGNELITEHLHPYARGFFLAAEEYAKILKENDLPGPRDAWIRNDNLSREQWWDLRPVTLLDEHVAQRRTQVLTAGWPFREGFPVVDAVPKDTLWQLAELAAKGQMDWKEAHVEAAGYYERRNEFALAAREYRAIADQIPHDLEAHLDWARMLYAQREYDAMVPVLRRSIRIEPTIQAYRTLGDIAMSKNLTSEAIVEYERMDAFTQSPQEQISNGMALAHAYVAAKRMTEAKQQALKVLAIAPDHQPAVQMLFELNKRGY